MAEKKYYWLKLPADFFQSKQIKKLRRIAGGDTYTIIYLKMLLKSLQDEGRLYYEGVEDSFADEIALDIDENPDDVKVTVQFLMSSGLMTDNGSEAMLEQMPAMIGSETASAERKRRQRSKFAENRDNVTLNRDIVQRSHIEIEKDIDKEKSKSRDRVSEDIEIDTLAQSSSESSLSALSSESLEAPFITLQLNNGYEFPFYEKDIDEYRQLYPAVDIEQQFRTMKGWCKDNPTRRKTKRGIRSFVNRWLAREQDKYHPSQRQSPGDVLQQAAEMYGGM